MQRREVIQERIKNLSERYKETCSFNKAAWDAYGSELCAGGMRGNEKKILAQIAHLNELLAMPEMDMNEEALGRQAEEASRKISFIEAEEKRLSAEKQKLDGYLARVKEIKSIPLSSDH